MQSGYCELIGLYLPGEANTDTLKLADLGVAAPPFTVRNAPELSAELGDWALPFGFVQVPLMNERIGALEDILTESCPKYEQIYKGVFQDPGFVARMEGLAQVFREPLGRALEIPAEIHENASYEDLAFWSDLLVAKKFEAPVMTSLFTEEQWESLEDFVSIRLVH